MQHPKKGISATRPGTLLRHEVPTRGGPPDTVAHGDDSTEGDYVNPLTFTGLYSGWTETDWAGRKTSLEYDLASQLKTIRRPNGTVRTMDYDAAGEATAIWEKTGVGTPIAMFKLNWNAAARMEWEFAAPPPHATPPPVRTMTYDDDNRLVLFNGQSVTHDLDGNMTSGPLTNNTLATYTFDARNRLVGTLSTASVTYGYDALNNRTSITNGKNITRFVVNPNAALSQTGLHPV